MEGSTPRSEGIVSNLEVKHLDPENGDGGAELAPDTGFKSTYANFVEACDGKEILIADGGGEGFSTNDYDCPLV